MPANILYRNRMESTPSKWVIEKIEQIESMDQPFEPETLLLLDLAKEAQRTGKMPDLSALLKPR